MNISLAAASRADDEREKAELIALVKQLTPKEVDRVIKRMQALLNGRQKKQEVAGCEQAERILTRTSTHHRQRKQSKSQTGVLQLPTPDLRLT